MKSDAPSALLRIQTNVIPGLVLFLLAVVFTALLVLQRFLPFFPASYDHDRLPAWAPVAYITMKEMIDSQPSKNSILIGDSVVHGDTSIRQDTVGCLLSRDFGFINLSNPSLAFETQALLLQAMTEQYPKKNIVLQINPKWLHDHWRPDKFLLFRIDLGAQLVNTSRARRNYLGDQSSRSYRKYRVIIFLRLDRLRAKIHYRWLNENLSSMLLRFLRHEPATLDQHPYVEQEEIIIARGNKLHPMDRRAQIKRLQPLLSAPPDIMKNEAFASLWEAVSGNPRVRIVLTPLNPGLLKEMTENQQKNYAALTNQFESVFRAAHVPYVRLKMDESDFLDAMHYNPEGHQHALKQIAAFLKPA